MPHQEEAIKFLEEHNGCGLLAMEPGTGKTLAALEFLARRDCYPALVIAPVSLLGMWKSEINRWYPDLRISLIRGTKLQREKAYQVAAEIYLIGYETFRVDYAAWASRLPVHATISDESGKIRTPTAKMSKAVRGFQTPIRIALDGTPVSNTIADLWNVIEWISPKTFFGNWWAFRKYYAIMNNYIPGKIDGWREPEKIVATANKHIFWKKKTDVLKDLPPMTQTDILLEPTPEEKRFYKEIKDTLRLEFEGQEITITNALALLMRLRQAANGVFSPDAEPTKVKALKELIETLPPAEKLVVFSQFETVVDRLTSIFGDTARKITGGLSAEAREQAVEEWRTDPGVRFLIMTSAGEKGLNLQCASYMVQFDLVWSAAAEEQRIGRVWRHGQDKPVTVWNLLMEGTVDVHMRRILSRKKKLSEDVATGQIALTYEEIEEILA